MQDIQNNNLVMWYLLWRVFLDLDQWNLKMDAACSREMTSIIYQSKCPSHIPDDKSSKHTFWWLRWIVWIVHINISWKHNFVQCLFVWVFGSVNECITAKYLYRWVKSAPMLRRMLSLNLFSMWTSGLPTVILIENWTLPTAMWKLTPSLVILKIKQCTSNLSMRRIYVTTVAIETQPCFHLCIIVGLHVDVNNAKILDVAMETHPRVPSGLFPNYKIFRTAVNIINVKINIENPPCKWCI